MRLKSKTACRGESGPVLRDWAGSKEGADQLVPRVELLGKGRCGKAAVGVLLSVERRA